MLLGTLGANLLTSKGTIRADEAIFRAGYSIVRAGQDF